MNPDTTHTVANTVDPSTMRNALAAERQAVSFTPMSHLDLIAKIQGIDGCSREQAEGEVEAFETAFRAM